MKLEFPWQVSENFSYIKFYENLSSGSRTVPCEQAGEHVDREKDRETAMTMLKVDFRTFGNVPNSRM
jgi:hypothetical protein